MAFTQSWFEVDFGSNYAAIGTTGYRLLQDDNTDSVARTTTGVVDLGNGSYGVPSVNVPDNAVGIEWDTGGGSPVYAREDIDPFRKLEAIFALLPATTISSAVDVAALSGDGLTAGESANLLAIFNALPATGLISNQADVSALIGQGLTGTQDSNLTAIFNLLPVSTIASAADVAALVTGLTPTQDSNLTSIFNALPATGLISNQADVAALIGQGLTGTQDSNLTAIFNLLPVSTIASAADVAAAGGTWSVGEKDQLIVDLDITKRQATIAVNNTEKPF